MGDFREIPDNLVKKISKELRHKNPYKADAFEKVINSEFLKIDKQNDKNRIDTFNRIWKNASYLTKIRYGFGKNKEVGKSLSEITSMLVKENTFYVSSVLENFQNEEGKTIKDRYEKAEMKTYEDRIEVFMEKYGDENVYAEDKKTLKDYFMKYLNKEISREEMNNIIEDFKNNNAEYLSSDYSAKNGQDSSLIKELFENV